MTLKLLSYNIRFGGRSRAPLIAGVIRRTEPDIVVFQEATDPASSKRWPKYGAHYFMGRPQSPLHRLHQPRPHSSSRVALPARRDAFIS